MRRLCEPKRERTGYARWFANFPYDRSGNLPDVLGKRAGDESTGNESTGNESTGNESTGNESIQTLRNELAVGAMKKEIKTFGKQQIQFAGPNDYPHLVNIGRLDPKKV